jgi:hypothetical protein
MENFPSFCCVKSKNFEKVPTDKVEAVDVSQQSNIFLDE